MLPWIRSQPNTGAPSPEVFRCQNGSEGKGDIMNIEKYTERVRGFIQSAQTFALSSSNQQFTPEHLLKVLVDDDEGLVASLIERPGGRIADVRIGLQAALEKLPKVTGG